MSPNGHLLWYPVLLHVTRGLLSVWNLYPPQAWCTNASTVAVLRAASSSSPYVTYTATPHVHNDFRGWRHLKLRAGRKANIIPLYVKSS